MQGHVLRIAGDTLILLTADTDVKPRAVVKISDTWGEGAGGTLE